MSIVKEKQNVIKPSSRRWGMLPALAEIVFLLAGVILTLAAHLFLTLFTEQMIRSEYERVTESTVTALADEFSDLERSIHTAATMLETSENGDAEKLFSRIMETDPSARHFDQVLFLYKNEAGQWEYKSFYNASEALYTIKPSQKLVAETGKFSGSQQARVIIDPAMFEIKTSGAIGDMRAKPFALLRLVEKEGVPAGLLAGVSHAGSILDKEWQKTHTQIVRMALRDVSADYDLFLFEQGTESDILDGAQRNYEFSFGGHRWEARTDYLMEEKFSFLTNIPFFAILVGFVLTTAGTLYIHGTQRQSLRVSIVNNALEQKNRELEEEMAGREKLHDVLKRAEEENRSIIDSVSDIIFEINTEGKILFLNATWRKIAGFEPSQSRGMDLFNMLHPQDQEKLRKDFQALVQGHKQAFRAFTKLRTKDGAFRSVELSVSMIRQDERKNLRVVGTLTDVEERRRAEKALVEAEKKYRAIVENAAGGIFQLTPEGIYLSVNPAMARILGYTNTDELLERVKNANEEVYFNGRERQYFLKELENTGVIHNYETQVVRKDGTRIWVNENARVVRDDSGMTLYYEGSLEDISQRKQAEISLRETKVHSDLANRAKSEFLANMSHELRTPLNSIIGFSEIIEKESFGPIGKEEYKQYASDIHTSGKKLLSVINEILDISKIEAGERYLNDQIVDLYDLAESCIKILENKAQARNLVVSNLMKDVPKIVGETLALKQVMVNLLSNAIKFTPSGGRVNITSDADVQGNLHVSITDTGIGIDESDIDKALSPFGQIHNDFNRHHAGTGLGLTLAQALVKLHDGKLEVFSQKGIGTTVTIIFPKDRIAPVKAEQAAPASENAVKE